MKIKQSITYDKFSGKMITEVFLKSKKMRMIKKGINGLAALCFVLYLIGLVFHFSLSILFLIVSVFIVVTGNFLLPFYIRMLNSSRVVSLIGKKESYTISDSNIQITSTIGSGKYSWDDCTDVISYNGYIGLLFKNQTIILKKSDLKEEEIDWLLDH